MVIPVDKAVSDIVGYLACEVNKVNNLRDKFLMFGALGAVKANSGPVLSTYGPYLKSVGVLTDQGFDTDSFRSALEMAFGNVPTVTVLGFTFNKSDATELLRRMEA